jgi:hypothetical protein
LPTDAAFVGERASPAAAASGFSIQVDGDAASAFLVNRAPENYRRMLPDDEADMADLSLPMRND